MPFWALIDGVRTLSLTLDDGAWHSLAGRVNARDAGVRHDCCPGVLVLKVSPRGRRFFAHKARPVECDWKPESDEHVDLKAAVCQAVCRVNGWSAEIEVRGPDWKADVLASRGDKLRIAFEVQLSAQGQAETARREQRYEEAGVLPCV